VARDLRLEIQGDSKSAHRALDDVADESDKAAATLRGLAAEMKKAAREGGHLQDELEDVGGTAKVAGGSVYVMGRQLDKAAEEMREAARAAEKLDGQLAASRAEIVKLNRELSNTDDPDKVVKALQKQYREYDKIQKVRKRIAKDEDDARKRSGEFQKALKALEGGPAKVSGKRGLFGGLFGGLLGAGSKAASGAASGAANAANDIPGLGLGKALLAASAAPAIGAVSSAALLAGGALAGVGAGVAGAVAGNPEAFRKKWESAITEISVRWQMASLGFQKPALRAFDIIKGAIDDIHIEKILSSAEKYVEPLAHGIAGFITPLVNGIGILVEKAGPVVKVLSKDLPVLGQAIEMAFSTIAGGSEGAAMALHDLIGYIGIAIIAFGLLARAATEAYKIIRIPIIPDNNLTKFEKWGRTLHDSAQSSDELAKSQESLSESMRKVNDAVTSQLDAMLALDRANDAASDGVERLKQAFKENGSEIDGNSEKAKKNRDVLQGIIEDYKNQRTAAIEAGDGSAVSMGKANAVLRQHLEDLRAVLVAHGDDTSALDKYIAELDSLDGKIVSVKVNVKYQEYNPGIALGNLLHHARGGESLGGPIVVGEHGPEVVWSDRGQYVSTTEQTQKLVSMMGRPSGGSTGATSTVSAPPMSQLEQAFAAVFMYLANRGILQVPGRAVV
jgi:methyl-accepting chemotaxis protein